MNFLKKTALVASIALAGMGSANAAGTFLLMDSGAPGDFENSWTFDSSAFNEAGAKGGSFVDFFLFNVPDDEYVSFSAFGSGVTFKPAAGSSAFDGFALFNFGTNGGLLDAQTGSTAHSIEGGEWLLTSGTYEIDLYGAFTRAGGTYEIDIFGSPVPEPSGWALLMAGLGVTGLMARRRKQQA